MPWTRVSVGLPVMASGVGAAWDTPSANGRRAVRASHRRRRLFMAQDLHEIFEWAGQPGAAGRCYLVLRLTQKSCRTNFTQRACSPTPERTINGSIRLDILNS